MSSPATVPSASMASPPPNPPNPPSNSESSAQMGSPQPPPSPKYGGFTRFEIELEFVQSLANPSYLLHLATSTTTTPPPHLPPPTTPNPATTTTTTTTTANTPNPTHQQHQQEPPPQAAEPTIPLLTHPPFIAYLSYLQYWTRPPYTKYLNYPGPTLKHLQLLQNERFREDVLRPEVVGALAEEGVRAAGEVHGGGSGGGR